MLDLLLAIGTIALQIGIIVTVVAWIANAPLARFVARHATLFLRIIFVGAVAGSLVYSEVLGFAPCILCWYQRLAIYPIAFLLFTERLERSALLRLQTLILSSAGLAVALFHKYLELFPNSSAVVCGVDGVSCTTLYVFQFGYITIPMMSITVLLSGVILSILAGRFPQTAIADSTK